MQGKYPHIEWLELHGNGIVHECAILSRDGNGNTFYIPLTALDLIDKKRLLDIVTNRNAKLYALYDLMSQITMKNGLNALAYFHQLAKCLTSSGQVIDVDPSRRGLASTMRKDEIDPAPEDQVTRGKARL